MKENVQNTKELKKKKKKRKKKEPWLVLTERDMGLLKFLFEHKIATMTQISKHCYPTTHIENARKRVSRMEKKGFLKSDGCIQNQKLLKTYHLSHVGYQEFYENYRLEGLKGFKLKSDCPNHDMIALEVIEAIKKKENAIEVLTENYIQALGGDTDDAGQDRAYEIRVDGFVKYKFNDSLINMAIEYEHSRKSPARYANLVDKYYYDSGLRGVFYFYKEDCTRRAIEKREAEKWHEIYPRFYFFKLENVQDLEKEMIFETWKGRKLTVT